jgi:ninein-like protein
MASDDEDAYVKQLKEVFNSCDKSGIGYLDKNELVQLCTKLQMQDQSDSLVCQLMQPGDRARVGALNTSIDDVNGVGLFL